MGVAHFFVNFLQGQSRGLHRKCCHHRCGYARDQFLGTQAAAGAFAVTFAFARSKSFQYSWSTPWLTAALTRAEKFLKMPPAGLLLSDRLRLRPLSAAGMPCTPYPGNSLALAEGKNPAWISAFFIVSCTPLREMCRTAVRRGAAPTVLLSKQHADRRAGVNVVNGLPKIAATDITSSLETAFQHRPAGWCR